jgi:glyoxylase-like metal-dependent hydrolase (beta-lactamase superfamily II)
MRIETLLCGTLKVKAEEMIKPLPLELIKGRYPVDAEGYMKLAMHSLLLEESGSIAVIDPGCADFLPSSISETYGLEITVPLEETLLSIGISAEQVTDVIFTHLHFDHGSGAFKRVPGNIQKTFPNASYHVLKEHYEYALKPDRKEASSFFTKLFRYIDRIYWLEEWKPEWIRFKRYYGHTRAMVVPVILDGSEPIHYLSDLIPMDVFLEKGTFSGYDLSPETAIMEKEDFLQDLSGSGRMIYFHDLLKASRFYP